MKAPNIIYLDEYSDGMYSTEWHTYSHSSKYTTAHEYVRKDALLEWAKARKECGAGLLAVDTLIDKINSL